MSQNTVPMLVVTQPKDSRSYILPKQLPGDPYKYALWHQLPKNKIKGNELKCPRIRKGPDVSSSSCSSSSSSSSSSDSDPESGRRRGKPKLRHDYKNEKENWKEAQIVNLSYQDLGHDYQLKNFKRVLQSLRSCVQLHLVDNSLTDLHSINLPACHMLNLKKNYFTSFKNLPSAPGVLHLNLGENNISNLDGCERFKKVQSLDLTLNPIQFTEGYRSRVFAKFPNLKFLDGIPLTSEDHPESYPDNTCSVQ
uniref:Protein phosphatase 1 regulatory subunit 42-like n=1 Tax=Phallusia mammillata TaxID=59560 RepID=A0A6F9DQ24_9ASCI|nr:protein phosphatase 1 regulatory subunit 42-like [Phallusia mammillata]